MDLEYGDAAFTPYHRGRTIRDAEDKEFIAWDGEGITPDGESRQNYVLFGNSKGFALSARKLSTAECLNIIIDTEKMYPNAIHCGFSFGYDVEMILCDLTMKHLSILRAKGNVRWREFRIEYKRSKWFQITKTDPHTKEKTTARIWDVWGFFQCSFVKAIEDNLDDVSPAELLRIQEGKAGRSQFAYADLDSGMMKAYWETELVYLVRMMVALRERLYAADLRIRHWHGPGAIATYAYRAHGMAKAMNHELGVRVSETDTAVNQAAQYAYAGGRFELFRIGHHAEKVYAYDIRSAYPSAIKELPSLSPECGTWQFNNSPDARRLARFGVYRLRFASDALLSSKPMPYFYRDPRYAIHFPNVVEGWYWTPEAEYAQFLRDDVTIVEGWEYVEDGSRPFAWVEDVYETRAQWKRDGNASQMALKLLLNSMYGKMAQRVGWEVKQCPPQWHQLEWAGYVTSLTRAKIFRAMLLAYKANALIGVETDGIFSAAPLDLDIGPRLGQWESEEYDAMIYLQSGFYFKRTDQEWSAKYRGFDKGSVTYEDAMTVLKRWQPWTGEKGIISGTTTRFATMGTYVNSPFGENLRNRWHSLPRELSIGGDGKRIHRPSACPQCLRQESPADVMHTTTVNYPIGGLSLPHSLPWLNRGTDPNPYRENEDNRNGD